MTDVKNVIDWLFNTFVNLWGIIIQSWVLSVPVLILIIANIVILIKGIYSNNN